MGLDVFGRIKDIVSANIDELLSKAEDPEKMADQMVRKYEDAIKDLLGSTASVMASAREAKAKVDACDAEIKKYGTYAERALRDGNFGTGLPIQTIDHIKAGSGRLKADSDAELRNRQSTGG